MNHLNRHYSSFLPLIRPSQPPRNLKKDPHLIPIMTLDVRSYNRYLELELYHLSKALSTSRITTFIPNRTKNDSLPSIIRSILRHLQQTCRLNIATFNIVLHHMAQHPNVYSTSLMDHVFHVALRRHLTPSPYTHTIMMSAYRKRQEYELAVKYFYSLPSCEAGLANSVNFQSSSANIFNELSTVFPKSHSARSIPLIAFNSTRSTYITYCEALQSLFKLKRLSDAQNVLRQLKHEFKSSRFLAKHPGSKLDSSLSPVFFNIRLYNILLFGFISNGDFAKAEKVAHYLHTHHITGNLWTLNLLIQLSLKQGNEVKATDLFMDFIFYHQPTVSLDAFSSPKLPVSNYVATFNIMLHHACIKGDVISAMDFISAMMKRKLNPTTYTFNTLLHGFFRAGHYHTACALVLDSFSSRQKNPRDIQWPLPDIVTLNILLKYVVKASTVNFPDVWLMISRIVIPSHLTMPPITTFPDDLPLCGPGLSFSSSPSCICQSLSNTTLSRRRFIFKSIWSILWLCQQLRISPDIITLSTLLHIIRQEWSHEHAKKVLAVFLKETDSLSFLASWPFSPLMSHDKECCNMLNTFLASLELFKGVFRKVLHSSSGIAFMKDFLRF